MVERPEAECAPGAAETSGFNTRTFELYFSELLHSEGFAPFGSEPQPDFTVAKNDVQISIECTTAKPSGNDADLLAYRSVTTLGPEGPSFFPRGRLLPASGR